MKCQKYAIVLLFPLLMAQTCVKDSEESNDENTEFSEIKFGKDEIVTKAMAIEDWEMFLKQSQQDIDRAETNIGNLETKIDEDCGDQIQQWQETSDYCNLELLKLKARRIQRNKEFESELKAYGRSAYDRNEAFETQFSKEMSIITRKLETVFERMRSGYYK